MAHLWTASNTRSSSRRKMASSFQEEALQEALFSLRKSRAGYVSAMTRACQQIDSLLVDYGNLSSVKALQASLDKTWNNYQESTARYRSLVDENSIEIREVNDQYVSQELRKHHYDQKIKEFTIAAATNFNEQLSRDLENIGLASPAPSVRSVSSRASKLSEAGERLHNTKMAAAKAALIEKQTELKRKRSVEIEIKRLEMEMNQKQFELKQQLELAKLEADRDISKAKEKAELAELEAKFAEAEFSQLLLNSDLSPSRALNAVELTPEITPVTSSFVVPAVSTQASTFPATPGRAYTFPVAHERAHGDPSLPTLVNTFPTIDTRGHAISTLTIRDNTLPPIATRGHGSLTLSTPFFPSRTVSSPPESFPSWSLPFVTSTHVYTRPIMSAQVPTSSSTDAIPVTPTRFLFATSCVSSVLDKPAMSSGVSNIANPSITRGVSGFQPMVTSHYSAARFKTAGQDYTCTVASAGPANVWRPPPAPLPSSENLLAMIATTMEKMNADRGLPAMQVLKFDGSPENYPVFRQRFHQMVESKALDEPTKMARLIQFLEGPALFAVQRYESVPGGLTKALQVLQDRFGQPFKVVRACVDALIKGPVIAPQDRHGLRRYADTAQVMHDTLESMNCLGEMNTDNLEKMILRLPKWAQTKFREHLKNLERQQGRVMPTFKDVVNFLNDRADVANHPFFSNPVSEMKTPNSKTPASKFTSLATEGATDQIENGNAVKHAKKTGKCPMCTRSHPLYRCETFKSKPVNERHEFIKRSRICFNCINSVEHSSRSCKSSVRCQKPECGKRHHTLLHFASFNPERNDAHQANHIENAAIHDVPVARPLQADLPVPLSGCATATMVRPSEILLQIVPLKVIGNNGTTVTTYGLIDSGSDVTMIDPSLVEKLEIQGESSQLLLSTVNQRDKRQQGLKVDFKIASIDDQDFRGCCVRRLGCVRPLHSSQAPRNTYKKRPVATP